MTTEVAFVVMIFTPKINKTLAVRRGTVGKWRHDIKTGDNRISLDKKIELLRRAGFKMTQGTKWVMPGTELTSNADDFLNDYPSLTLFGRIAGMSDDQIRKANEAIIKQPTEFLKLYKQMG